jgi:8-oxo-dGTP diphosphatase
VVSRGEEVLLVRRANPPDQGKWGFPGGKIEYGEAVPHATLRELREETGIEAEILGPVDVIDFLEREGARTGRHFILIAMHCRWVSGDPVAADDALEARWWPVDAIGGLDTSHDVERIARLAIGRDG